MADFLTPVNQVLTGGLSSGASNPVSAYAFGGAAFGTQQAGVDLKRQVRYALVNPSVNVFDSPRSFIFPISPQSMTITRMSLVNWFETQGTNATNSGSAFNVRRIVDLYGLTPMIFTIRGTTGFNKYYVDGYKKNGTEWTKQLQTFIETYFQDLQNNPLNPDNLQFLDFWYQEYWNVVPAGPVRFSQDATRPIWMFYDLTLIGTTRIQNQDLASSQIIVKNSVSQAQNNLGKVQQIMGALVTSAALVGPYI